MRLLRAVFVVAVIGLASPLLIDVSAAAVQDAVAVPAPVQDEGARGGREAGPPPCGDGRGRQGNREGREGRGGREGREAGAGREGREGGARAGRGPAPGGGRRGAPPAGREGRAGRGEAPRGRGPAPC